MAGPWEKYASPEPAPAADGPWSRYAASAPPPAAPDQPMAYDAMGNPTGVDQGTLPTTNMPYGEQMANVGRFVDNGVRLLANGATLGAADKFAGKMDALTGRADDADQAVAAERARTQQIRKDAPTAAAVTEGVGNVMGMAALGRLGLPVFGGTGGLMARTLKAGGSMGAAGAAAGGFNSDADSLMQRGKDAGYEGGVQGALGASGPLLGAAIGKAAGLITSPITSRLTPEAASRADLARALQASGKAPDEIAGALRTAAAEGQPMYSVADAIGNEGGRTLTKASKAPGAGRDLVYETLESRQAGQARRLSNQISEGFNAPETAAQAEARLTAQRKADAAVNYGGAREGARPVDVSPAIENANASLLPTGADAIVSPGSQIAQTAVQDGIEAAMSRAKSLLTDGKSQVFDFDRAFRAKVEIDDMASEAFRKGLNNQGDRLSKMADALDEQLAAASDRYAAARDTYRKQSLQIEAVDKGRQAAKRGRTEDTLPVFQGMSAEEQAAFRPGYADPYIESLQKTPAGSNAARPLTSEAVRTEFPAFAEPGRGDKLMRQIDRENQMFRTRQVANGGSATSENLADAGVPIGALGDLAHGNTAGLFARAINAVGRINPGSSEASRLALARQLLETNPETAAAVLSSAKDSLAQRQLIAAMLGRSIAQEGKNYLERRR